MSRTLPPLTLALALLATPACRSAAEHHEAADDEVYAILAERRAELDADRGEFRVEPPAGSLRQRILEGGWPAEGESTELGLVELLAIAAENAREYQDRKEDLYLTALDLTFERYQFDTQYGGVLGLFAGGTGDDVSAREASAEGGFSRLLGSGAQIIGDIGLRLFKDLSTGNGWDLVSTLDLTVTQPLLAGSSPEVVREPLTQAERDVLYEVRSFERFRRTFGFDVADRVYRILQQVDTLENARANHVGLVRLRERNEALGEAGRLSDIEVDQALQQELGALNGVIDAEQRLDGLLDSFKLFLGLPVETPLGVRREELEQLIETGLVAVDPDEELVIATALEQRLDYQTVLDELQDAERRVRVAEDALGAGLTLTGTFAATSDADRPLKFSSSNVGWAADLALDLPLDRLSERNAFRRAELDVALFRRRAEETADGIRADLRDALRGLRAARESYEIQRNSVELARGRIESTSLKLEAGRAETRDLLEAQEDLLAARNGATRALIDYTLASLSLYRDMGLLRLDDDGLHADPELQARILETP